MSGTEQILTRLWAISFQFFEFYPFLINLPINIMFSPCKIPPFPENSYISEGNYALQLIEVTSAPFLVNFSIPSLNNSRSLRWSYQSGTQMSTSTGVLERVKDPCPQMEQFKKGENCGMFRVF